MSIITAKEVREFIVNFLKESIKERNFTEEDITDNFDLLTEGVIDSLGIIEIIQAIEENFGFEIDFEDLDAENFTIIGPLCQYIEQKSIKH